MACSCGKTKCACDTEFVAPMRALWEIYDGIAGKADVVAIAWEREDGKVFRYDLPFPNTRKPSHQRVWGVSRSRGGSTRRRRSRSPTSSSASRSSSCGPRAAGSSTSPVRTRS